MRRVGGREASEGRSRGRVAELYAELHKGNSEKKGHACLQFRTLRWASTENWLVPVSSSKAKKAGRSVSRR